MSQAELKQINNVQFGVWNPEELSALSVCEVTSTGTYENGLPVVNGLLDQRMGVTDRGLKCLTCKMDEEHCPGHFGHISLAVPVVHCGFADTVLQVLRCICFHCGKLLISPQGAKAAKFQQLMQIQHPQKRLQAFSHECAGINKCEGSIATETFRNQQLQALSIEGRAPSGGCNGTQPTYKRVGFKISRLFAKQQKKKGKGAQEESNNEEENDIVEQADLSGTEILGILSKMSDETVQLLGFNPKYAHPKWLITTRLPVPPPQVRPSVTFNGSDRSADDITVCLVQILKTNAAITKALANSATEQAIAHDIESLTLACAQLVNNEQGNIKQMTSKGGKILKTLRQRVVGKGGRIRSNLMGKRVNFCARTVITGDPNLGIDFVGVPRWVARTLTYPENVTRFNKERLQELVRRGPELYPGAQRVIKPDGSIIHLKYAARSGDIVLQDGYIVERHIVDNDFILFNRQPSLHKMSLMGHKVKVMPFSSFRLNLSCTSPYNADFDGDEMNLHVAQTNLLRAEIAELMLSPRQIVSPQASKPVMGIVQDSLLGVSKFTRRDTFCDRNLTNNLLMCIDTWDGRIPQPAILQPVPLWSGKQIFSLIIPKGINLHRGSKHRPKNDKDTNMSFSDATVLISDGQLISGIVDASTVGKTEAGIIHLTWLERGWDDTRQFMTSCQKLVNNWLVTSGFSVGIYDLMADSSTLERVDALVKESHDAVERLIDQARSGTMKRKPGHSVISTFEANVNEQLGQAIQKTGAAVQEKLARDNSINAMVYAGSKGSHLNISQIVACVGQQNVSGRRVPFAYRKRTLPHFQKEDVGAASRGFVSSSYIKGLTPTEFMFHACLSTVDHQILTNQGFLFAEQIQQYYQPQNDQNGQNDPLPGLLFAQHNQDDNTVSYVKASEWIHRQIAPTESMFLISSPQESLRWVSNNTQEGPHRDLQSNKYGHLEQQNLDFDEADNNLSVLVTNNHQMWVQPTHNKSPITLAAQHAPLPFQFAEAQNLAALPGTQIRFVSQFGNGLQTSLPQFSQQRQSLEALYSSLDLEDQYQQLAFQRLVGFALLTSTFHTDTTSLAPLLTISAPRDSDLDALSHLCQSLSLTPHTHFQTQHETATLQISFPPLVAALTSSATATTSLPSWYQSLNKFEARALLSGLEFSTKAQTSPSSGHNNDDNHNHTITAPSTSLRDQISLLTLHAGYTSHFTLSASSTWSITYTDQEIDQTTPVLNKSTAIQQVPYTGTVFCVTIPKHRIITRRARADANGDIIYASRPIVIGNCGGREGLVDTAVKTAETGYIQRRLVKSMESIKVHYDATVRNSLGDIIQFVYGEDGMDGAYIEKQNMDHVGLDNNSMIATYFFDLKQPELLDSLVTDEVKEEVLDDIEAETLLTQELIQLRQDRDFLRQNTSVLKFGESTVRLPCNLHRIVLSAQQKFDIKLEGGVRERTGVIRLDIGKRSDLSPLYVVRQVKELLSRLIVVPGKSDLSQAAQANAITLFSMFIRQFFSSKRVLGEFHLNRKSFDYVLGEVESRFKQALVHPGEMVGAIAAQSIGEPATQMTLNTFHLAGVAAKNASSGVPRLVEIINVARNVKMKGMCIELSDKEAAKNEKMATNILNQLEYTRICDIAESVEIYHDPNPLECVIDEDRDTVESYLVLPDDDFDYEAASPWLLRIVLDPGIIIAKKLEPDQLKSLVNQHFKNTTNSYKIKCISSPTLEEGKKPVLHIRISRSGQNFQQVDTNNGEALLQSFQGGDEDHELKFLYQVKDVVLEHIKLRGITDITKIFLSKRPVKVYSKVTGGLETIPESQPDGLYWYFDTEGTNLPEVITHPDVDHTTCYSNFCPDMLPVCGIEATRASILKELRGVIEADGSHISYRHLAMLVDIMTFKGGIMSITRHGFNRLQTGPLMRCSFEESVEILMDAAAFSENDPLSGISEQVMMGQLANIGTGSFDVVLDVDALMKANKDDTAVSAHQDIDAQDVYNPFANMDGSDLPLDNYVSWDSPQSKPYFPASSSYAAAASSSYLSPSSSTYSATSSRYSPSSVNGMSPTSASYSYVSSTSNQYSPSSTNMSPTSANYLSPTSGSFSPTSNQHYSPSSGSFSPMYSPTGHDIGSSGGASSFSPASTYSPTSANYEVSVGHEMTATSGAYGASANSGSYGASVNSGAYGASANSGAYGASANSGAYASANSGIYGSSANSGAYVSANSASYSPQSGYQPNTSYSPTGDD